MDIEIILLKNCSEVLGLQLSHVLLLFGSFQNIQETTIQMRNVPKPKKDSQPIVVPEPS